MTAPADVDSGGRGTAVFTDGACIGNGHRNAVGAIGVFFGDDDPRNVSRRVALPPGENRATNQSMELLACCVAIETFFDGSPSSAPPPPSSSFSQRPPFLHVYTDSEYVVKIVNNWARGWERAGWRTSTGKPVSNLTLVRRLYELKKRHPVAFAHVPAHREAPPPGASTRERALWHGNMRADELARRAATAPVPAPTLSPPSSQTSSSGVGGGGGGRGGGLSSSGRARATTVVSKKEAPPPPARNPARNPATKRYGPAASPSRLFTSTTSMATSTSRVKPPSPSPPSRTATSHRSSGSEDDRNRTSKGCGGNLRTFLSRLATASA